MLEPWIVPVAILIAFAVLLLMPLAELALGSVRRRRFRCPLEKRRVSVEFLERTALGISRPVDVRSCSAFPNPQVIDCDKRCLELPSPGSAVP